MINPQSVVAEIVRSVRERGTCQISGVTLRSESTGLLMCDDWPNRYGVKLIQKDEVAFDRRGWTYTFGPA